MLKRSLHAQPDPVFPPSISLIQRCQWLVLSVVWGSLRFTRQPGLTHHSPRGQNSNTVMSESMVAMIGYDRPCWKITIYGHGIHCSQGIKVGYLALWSRPLWDFTMEKVNKLQEGTEDTESWTSHINLTKKSKIFLMPISRGSDKNCTEYSCRGDQVS